MSIAAEDREQRPRPSRWGWWVLVAILVAVVLVVALAGSDPRKTIDAGLLELRAAGPAWYFLAMAVVPLPLATFTVPAGEAFAAQLGIGGVVAAAAAAVAVQQSLSYWLACTALRPFVERLVRRRGLAVPAVTAENARSVALLVRLTPGPPMILGSCVLALARVPFAPYLLVSWLVALPWVFAGVILGRGVLSGNVPLAMGGLGLMIAAAVAARWWHRRRPRETA